MSSFRLANGLHANFAFVDKPLAERVHNQYKEQTIALAEYFLQFQRATRTGLICGIVRCAKGVPAQQKAHSIASPPILVQAQITEEIEKQASSYLPQPSTPSTTSIVTEPTETTRQNDTVTLAYKEVVLEEGVPPSPPRGSGPKAKPLPVPLARDKVRYLTLEEWKRYFEEAYFPQRK